MNLILDGLLLGLTLAILLGPIFVALTQTGIQRGVRAGLSVGTGIWISDILVIVTAYFFIKEIDEIAHLALKDKKNKEHKIKCVFLDKTGDANFDNDITLKDIVESLSFYNS